MIAMKRLSLAVAVMALVAGCSSGVKLDDSASNANASSTAGAGAGAGGAGTSGVTGVDLSGSAAAGQGPVGVSRIVYFDFDSYSIKSDAQAQIEAHARFIKEGNRKVVIEGHTDERGGREYNLALGQKRAEAVAKSLALLGAKDNQVDAVSFGKERPAVQGSDEAAWAKNRRAELIYR